MTTKDFKRVVFDVDGTLIHHEVPADDPEAIALFYSDSTPTMFVKPYKKHIEFLKNLKVSNFHITVHSRRGLEWAERIVKLLGLESYVDRCETKPCIYVDDERADVWMEQVYIKES